MSSLTTLPRGLSSCDSPVRIAFNAFASAVYPLINTVVCGYLFLPFPFPPTSYCISCSSTSLSTCASNGWSDTAIDARSTSTSSFSSSFSGFTTSFFTAAAATGEGVSIFNAVRVGMGWSFCAALSFFSTFMRVRAAARRRALIFSCRLFAMASFDTILCMAIFRSMMKSFSSSFANSMKNLTESIFSSSPSSASGVSVSMEDALSLLAIS
mmetsp:Transcript_18380/g.46092  ORF Transcript_18380/g.46092 Transcript_18380/m.46092 type:complete len:211 (+) Transcript_18380:1936-2568(+)